MSVLDRSELEQSHLADLHAIASELGIEGFRRLSRNDLIEAILAGDDGGDESSQDEPAEEKPRGRSRRLRLRRGRDEQDAGEEDAGEEPASDEKDDVLGESDGDDGAEVVLDEGDDSESAADEPKPREKQEDSRTGVLDILPGG